MAMPKQCLIRIIKTNKSKHSSSDHFSSEIKSKLVFGSEPYEPLRDHTVLLAKKESDMKGTEGELA